MVALDLLWRVHLTAQTERHTHTHTKLKWTQAQKFKLSRMWISQCHRLLCQSMRIRQFCSTGARNILNVSLVSMWNLTQTTLGTYIHVYTHTDTHAHVQTRTYTVWYRYSSTVFDLLLINSVEDKLQLAMHSTLNTVLCNFFHVWRSRGSRF